MGAQTVISPKRDRKVKRPYDRGPLQKRHTIEYCRQPPQTLPSIGHALLRIRKHLPSFRQTRMRIATPPLDSRYSLVRTSPKS